MRISQLEGRAVALWGWGREGRAAYRAVRTALPAQPLTVFCSTEEARELAALDDAALQVETDASAQALGRFEIVLKSPGISPYRAEALAAAAQGTQFIGGTALWFAEHAQADDDMPGAICVTGTKGKSTTTALLAHLLRSAGHRTALVGNIGQPLLEVLAPQPPPAYWAIELSSYQTGEVARSGARPQLALVLNLFPEHLDWHGDEARYVRDKLSLVTEGRPRIALLNAADPLLRGVQLPDSEVRWFNHPDGWHLRGEVVYCGAQAIFDTANVPLPGEHNRRNLCAVLAAVEALGLDAAALAPAASSFRPLPNRLQWLGSVDGISYVNDSISTTPMPRWLRWPASRNGAWPCWSVDMTAGWIGRISPRIWRSRHRWKSSRWVPMARASTPCWHRLPRRGISACTPPHDLQQAMQLAREALGEQGGVVLLSPGAPSFGAYSDYVARGRHFAQLAGFDPEAISAIPGLGVQ